MVGSRMDMSMSALTTRLVLAAEMSSRVDAIAAADGDAAPSPDIQVVPGRRRRRFPAPFRPLVHSKPEAESHRTIMPTPERRRHHQDMVEQTVEIEAPVNELVYDKVTRESFTREIRAGVYGKATRVVRGVATLGRAGDIGTAELKAANRYTREYETGIAKMRLASLEAERGGTGGDASGITTKQLDALTSIRQVHRALGCCGGDAAPTTPHRGPFLLENGRDTAPGHHEGR